MTRLRLVLGVLAGIVGCDAVREPSPPSANDGGGSASSGTTSSSTGMLPPNDPCAAAAPSCPTTQPCSPLIEPEDELWTDRLGNEVQASEIIAVSNKLLILQKSGEPAVAYPDDPGGFVYLPVAEPHEPDLRPVSLTNREALFCGAEACAVYDIGDDALALAPYGPVPLPSQRVRGIFATAHNLLEDPDCAPAETEEPILCVYGQGIACTVRGSSSGWTVLAPPTVGDDFLAAVQLTPSRIRFVGEGGRMVRVDASEQNGGIVFNWLEEDRVTTADLHAIHSYGGQAGTIAGSDGTVIEYWRNGFVACDTGDQDWRLAPRGYLFGGGGELYSSRLIDPRNYYDYQTCIAEMPAGRLYTAAADAGWGLLYTDGLRAYQQYDYIK